ncbi:MAG: YfiR family protein [Desulfatitalea sp.]|nr:YfiR family protein [Desulfatitalea sp.]NNJ99493.1 YfiR family protein [Desulfatitalea sp.]
MLMAVMGLSIPLWPLSGKAAPVSEYRVKAAFVYNFAKFVEWPTGALPPAPFVIGILGQDPFGMEIEVLDGKTLRNRDLVVIRSDTVEELMNSDVLFISASMKGRLTQVMERLNHRPVLTVSDSPGFAQGGVMINLYTQANKIRFEINPRIAERAGLKISSHLLRLARIVAE